MSGPAGRYVAIVSFGCASVLGGQEATRESSVTAGMSQPHLLREQILLETESHPGHTSGSNLDTMHYGSALGSSVALSVMAAMLLTEWLPTLAGLMRRLPYDERNRRSAMTAK
ncbi:hypothetical protein FVE85_6846 [Porphyridium purpureum]|uniref:Uncharacterized protein n=1 Tax=Porphyridium purpureum TaxID=35688 RepID=A0A5J4Z5X4_PORPP|nr:hypothetical protein FVE85_6846 [Porphyridium purpureum]|eukprot:POR3394..scf295_1